VGALLVAVLPAAAATAGRLVVISGVVFVEGMNMFPTTL
jgi:hypothetical protein